MTHMAHIIMLFEKGPGCTTILIRPEPLDHYHVLLL